MDRPAAVLLSPPTTELIEKCRAAILCSQLARRRIAATRSETVELLALMRDGVERLREARLRGANMSFAQERGSPP